MKRRFQRWHRQVGARLRVMREHRGLTQADVADAMGIARTSFVRLEAGERRLHDEQILLLCETLDITPSYLLLGYVSDLTIATTDAAFCDWLLAPAQRTTLATIDWRHLNRRHRIAEGRRRHSTHIGKSSKL